MNKINAVLLCFFVIASGCGGGGGDSNSSEIFSISVATKNSSSQYTTDFNVGDKISIETTITNISSQTQGTKDFNIGYKVYDSTGTTTLYDSSYCEPETGCISLLTVLPFFQLGTSATIDRGWLGTDNSGNLLSSGNYIIITNGSFTVSTTGQEILFSQTTEITLN